MIVQQIAASKNDEFYTPKYAIKPILKYIPKDKVVWLPFDTEESNFKKLFNERGNKTINTHISDREKEGDFFKIEVPKCDYIISNPPYSLKTEILQRLFEIDKPFAMLLGVVGLFESQKRFEMFRDNTFEIMYFNRRVSYMKDYTSGITDKQPPFSSVYITHNILPKPIMFEEINKKDI